MSTLPKAAFTKKNSNTKFLKYTCFLMRDQDITHESNLLSGSLSSRHVEEKLSTKKSVFYVQVYFCQNHLFICINSLVAD